MGRRTEKGDPELAKNHGRTRYYILMAAGPVQGEWTSTTIIESPQLGGLIIAGNAQGDRAFGLFEKAALEQP